MNIIIVEDDKNQRFLMNNYFGKKYNISLAESYNDFTFQMEKKIPDIVITDMNLEDEKNGLDIIKRAKELSPSVRIIVLTAYGNIENAVKAIKLGGKIVHPNIPFSAWKKAKDYLDYIGR